MIVAGSAFHEFTLPFLEEYDVGDLLVEGSAANRLVAESISVCRATNIVSIM